MKKHSSLSQIIKEVGAPELTFVPDKKNQLNLFDINESVSLAFNGYNLLYDYRYFCEDLNNLYT